MEKIDFNQIFEKFNHLNVIIIGDVMVDAYLWGKVSRISPEAPVPIIACESQENRLGGAANVALNIQALGANPILCGIIGDDFHGKEFLQLMETNKLGCQGIIIDSSRPTTTKTRIISANHHMLRVDEESEAPISGLIEVNFVQNIENLIHKTKIDAIIFEDYDKGAITPSMISRIVHLANENNIPTLVDPKKRNFMDYKDVTVFKPNFKELVEGLKLEIKNTDFEAIFEAAKIMHQHSNIKNMLITLSELGVFISNNDNYFNIPAEKRDIADVSGAGDTVISIASVCMAIGLDIKDIATIANIGGGLVCEKVGVVPIEKKLLLAECIEYFTKSEK